MPASDETLTPRHQSPRRRGKVALLAALILLAALAVAAATHPGATPVNDTHQSTGGVAGPSLVHTAATCRCRPSIRVIPTEAPPPECVLTLTNVVAARIPVGHLGPAIAALAAVPGWWVSGHPDPVLAKAVPTAIVAASVDTNVEAGAGQTVTRCTPTTGERVLLLSAAVLRDLAAMRALPWLAALRAGPAPSRFVVAYESRFAYHPFHFSVQPAGGFTFFATAEEALAAERAHVAFHQVLLWGSHYHPEGGRRPHAAPTANAGMAVLAMAALFDQRSDMHAGRAPVDILLDDRGPANGPNVTSPAWHASTLTVGLRHRQGLFAWPHRRAANAAARDCMRRYATAIQAQTGAILRQGHPFKEEASTTVSRAGWLGRPHEPGTFRRMRGFSPTEERQLRSFARRAMHRSTSQGDELRGKGGDDAIDDIDTVGLLEPCLERWGSVPASPRTYPALNYYCPPTTQPSPSDGSALATPAQGRGLGSYLTIYRSLFLPRRPLIVAAEGAACTWLLLAGTLGAGSSLPPQQWLVFFSSSDAAGGRPSWRPYDFFTTIAAVMSVPLVVIDASAGRSIDWGDVARASKRTLLHADQHGRHTANRGQLAERKNVTFLQELGNYMAVAIIL